MAEVHTKLAAGPCPLELLDQLPRVLVLSQTIPQTVYAGSILLYRLFKDYPADRLLVVGPAAHRSAQVLSCAKRQLGLPLERLQRTRLSRLVRGLSLWGLMPPPGLGPLAHVVSRFLPQVVVTVMQVEPYYYLAYRYARQNRLPLVLIVHDLAEVFEPVYRWASRRQDHRNAEVYRYACKRLCVSPEMCRHLAERYGAPGDVLYPNRSEELTARPAGEALALKRPPYLTLGYPGAFGYGYETQLQRMMPTFRQAGVRLNLYCMARPSWAAADVVNFCGYAPVVSETWRRVQAECDAVILPYPWADSAQQALYRTHFPSKLTEYLGLGMPVLIVGPAHANGVRWGMDNPRACLTVTADDPAAWAAALCRLRGEPGLRQSLAEQAVLSGDRDFHPVAIRWRFLDHLRAAAWGGADADVTGAGNEEWTVPRAADGLRAGPLEAAGQTHSAGGTCGNGHCKSSHAPP